MWNFEKKWAFAFLYTFEGKAGCLMDKPTEMKNLLAKFQVSQSLESMGLRGPDSGLGGPNHGLQGPNSGLRGPNAGLQGPNVGLQGPNSGP